jgi:hypothetical protein
MKEFTNKVAVVTGAASGWRLYPLAVHIPYGNHLGFIGNMGAFDSYSHFWAGSSRSLSHKFCF